MDTDTKVRGEKGPRGAEGPTGVPEAHPEPTAEQMRQQADVAADRASQTQAVRTAAAIGAGEAKGPMTPEAQASALDWFLSDEEVPMEYTLDVDIGPPDGKRIVPWTITAISSDTLKAIRAAAQEGNRGRRRGMAAAGQAPEINEQEMNARIVVAGSVNPNLVDAAAKRGAPEHPDPMTAPVQLLQHRLRHKPGLIDQLSGEVLRISGYDDDDIREHEAGKA